MIDVDDRRAPCGFFHSTRLNLWQTKFVTTITRDTSKATLGSNVSCHLIHAPSVHGQTYLLDSMHPCLNVDEIVRPIAHELVTSGGKASAVSLAWCCKSFEDPVLDVLWAEQEGLLPLLKSLPGGVWNDDECTVSVPKTCDFFSPQRFDSTVL